MSFSQFAELFTPFFIKSFNDETVPFKRDGLIDQGACSSVWLERTPDKREVGCSSQPRPTRNGALA